MDEKNSVHDDNVNTNQENMNHSDSNQDNGGNKTESIQNDVGNKSESNQNDDGNKSESNQNDGANKSDSRPNDEMSCELDIAVLLFYQIIKSLNTQDKLKFIVFARLISHLVVTCDELF